MALNLTVHVEIKYYKSNHKVYDDWQYQVASTGNTQHWILWVTEKIYLGRQPSKSTYMCIEKCVTTMKLVDIYMYCLKDESAGVELFMAE